jgi:periplasmic copper chaperone A
MALRLPLAVSLLAVMAPLSTAFVAGVALAVLAGVAGAHDYTLKDLLIDHPSARPTPPGARVGGAYFTLENRGRAADRLVRVDSPVAGSAELHSMAMEGNLMKMRPIVALDIPAGAKVALAPGGYHVMLVDLKRPLVAGEAFPLRLTFERAGTIEVSARIEAAAGVPAASGEPLAPAHGMHRN